MMVTFHGMKISKFKKVQTVGCFTNFLRQCRMQVVNQSPCYRIGALASILEQALGPSSLICVRPSRWTEMGPLQGNPAFCVCIC